MLQLRVGFSEVEGAGGYSRGGGGGGGGRGLQLGGGGITVGWAFSRGMLQLAGFPGGKGE